MVVSLGFILVGLLLLVAGGELLLRGAVGAASLLRLTPAVIGLTVVAAGTSVPELAVSGLATLQGSSAIAVANVIGSNIFNLTFIVGLCALVRPIPITGNTIRLEYPVLALVTLLCLVIAQDGSINRLDATLCLAVYVGFTAYLIALVREQVTREEAREFKSEVQEFASTDAPRGTFAIVGLIVGGIVLLGAGAQATVTGAVELARLVGWSERVIGLTIVSAGTGLPEVVASVVSAVRGRSDIAVANVVGSNLFNILVILGISANLSPLHVQQEIIDYDAWWMLGMTVLVFPLLYSGRRILRWEGALLVGLYASYLVSLI